MAGLDESVRTHLDGVTPEKRRRDAETMLELMTRVTGESPRLCGSVIGFGQYHYKYKSGREGDAPAAGAWASSYPLISASRRRWMSPA
jgi:hypothetical protein